MKRFTRCVCLLLVMAITLVIPAYAVEGRASNYFWSSSVYLYKLSGTTFEAWFSVDAVGIMDELGASVIKIQRSSDGENWMTMRTYTKGGYSNLICKDTGCHASYITYTGVSGYYYRAFYILYAKDSNGSAEAYWYSAPILL